MDLKRTTARKIQNPRKLPRQKKIFPSDKIAAELIEWLNSHPDCDLERMVLELQKLDQLAKEIDWSGVADAARVPARRATATKVLAERVRRRQGAAAAKGIVISKDDAIKALHAMDYASEQVRDWFLGNVGRSSGEAPSHENEKQEWARIELGLLADSLSSKMRAHQFATYSAIAPNRFFGLRGDEKPYALVRRRYDAGSADPEIAVSEFHETLAFRAFEEIVEREWAWRLRRCDCRRWFCARRDNQIHCQDERCRQRKYDNSPRAKKRRKEYDAMQKKKSFRSTSRKS